MLFYVQLYQSNPHYSALGSAAAHVEQEISPDARACRDTPVGSCTLDCIRRESKTVHSKRIP
ncbi:MAG: hypothetical protein MZU79_05650, partial [Anaerotruncus sp.]|nr:hypothetical protein [Anaerotruncus sp.]